MNLRIHRNEDLANADAAEMLALCWGWGRTGEWESVEANRRWFGGDYAPTAGATIGLRTILAARRILILAYGSHKSRAVREMLETAAGPHCAASFLSEHPQAVAVVDAAAAANLELLEVV